jgi:membrane associated rhomboid family serine protease
MTHSEVTDGRGSWIVGTLWRVALAAIVTVILANAVQTYFLDRTIPGIASGAAGGVIAVVAGLRRKRRMQTTNTQKNT